tara:strand:- start:6055 stop:6489 length:435 start_codon:yes stop_codon:yes gene_type:complete
MALKTISGSNIILEANLTGGSTTTTPFAASSSATFNVNQETIDVTNKDSSGTKEFLNGVTSWTMDAECYAIALGTDDCEIKESIVAAVDGVKIYVRFNDVTGQTNSKNYHGYGYVTSISQSASVNEWSTYSISIQGTGALTMSS